MNIEKTCSGCNVTQSCDLFIKNRNVCKLCSNAKSRIRYSELEVGVNKNVKCNACLSVKLASEFIKNRNVCRECNNKKRRSKYSSDVDFRVKAIQSATTFKKERANEKNEQIKTEIAKMEELIGAENTICKYCETVKLKTQFRHNRLKCVDCERDDPVEKFKRAIRTRIYIALNKNKSKHTIEYLGCDSEEYKKWIEYGDDKFTMSNHGEMWHIDHVIPLSRFNMDSEEEQQVAFNWRNTMALSAKDNLTKNNRILQTQIESHLHKLINYHRENNKELPKKYIELFAKHLVAGSPLEPLLLSLCGKPTDGRDWNSGIVII